MLPDYEFLIPGEGEMDYHNRCIGTSRRWTAAGYTGSITVEISKQVQARPDYDPFAAARQSYEVLNAAWHQKPAYP